MCAGSEPDSEHALAQIAGAGPQWVQVGRDLGADGRDDPRGLLGRRQASKDCCRKRGIGQDLVEASGRVAHPNGLPRTGV
ncbi:hypothetical protein SBBP2_1820002 [Burkholderiales bacterium]|nr:hypothetical protein SBBP2_1820002 [Burkholderiales bacterium]